MVIVIIIIITIIISIIYYHHHHHCHHYRYEIIAGNYEQKFSIDKTSGVISVVEPLQGFSNGRSERALEEIDPIITLQVRTQDWSQIL